MGRGGDGRVWGRSGEGGDGRGWGGGGEGWEGVGQGGGAGVGRTHLLGVSSYVMHNLRHLLPIPLQ